MFCKLLPTGVEHTHQRWLEAIFPWYEDANSREISMWRGSAKCEKAFKTREQVSGNVPKVLFVAGLPRVGSRSLSSWSCRSRHASIAFSNLHVIRRPAREKNRYRLWRIPNSGWPSCLEPSDVRFVIFEILTNSARSSHVKAWF